MGAPRRKALTQQDVHARAEARGGDDLTATIDQLRAERGVADEPLVRVAMPKSDPFAAGNVLARLASAPRFPPPPRNSPIRRP